MDKLENTTSCFFSKKLAQQQAFAYLVKQCNGNYILTTHVWNKKNISFKTILSIKETIRPDLEYAGDAILMEGIPTTDFETDPNIQAKKFIKQDK